jgi:hypothetical protein
LSFTRAAIELNLTQLDQAGAAQAAFAVLLDIFKEVGSPDEGNAPGVHADYGC